MIRQADPEEHISPAVFIYKNIGPTMQHNYLCACCRNKPAIIDLDTGILQPCRMCMKIYRVVKISWIDRFLKRIG